MADRIKEVSGKCDLCEYETQCWEFLWEPIGYLVLCPNCVFDRLLNPIWIEFYEREKQEKEIAM